jgi:hypothetical protein
MRTVYVQQHSHARWRDNPALRDHVALLSPEVLDLLDRCFEMDEPKRCAGRAEGAHEAAGGS